MNQIRVNKTPQIEKVLAFLKNKYQILSEAEIIKIALSEKYEKESEVKQSLPSSKQEEEKRLRGTYARLMKEGKKIGDRMLAEKGLKREDLSEQELYDHFFDDHKQNS